MLDLRPDSLQRCAGTQVVAHVHSLARFLQTSLCGVQVRGRLLESGTGQTFARSGIEEGSTFSDERGKLCRGMVHIDAYTAFRVGGVPRSILGMLTTLECVAQCEPVISGGHRRVGVLECFGRRRVLVCCVPVGASRPRGVDSALSLIHLPLRRLRASGREKDQQKTRWSGESQAHREVSITSMKDVAPQDRPREKLERLGAQGLGDNELVALVIGSGSRDIGALELANRLIASAGGLHGLTRIGVDGLRHLAGVGPAKAAQVVAAVELGRRTLARGVTDRPRLTTPRDLAAFLLPQYGTCAVERFGIVMLDTKHRVIRVRIVSIGSLDSAIVHPREVFREAASASAAAVVLFHNHPSGDPTPSPDDLALTTRMVSAGDVMGIDVLDHLILADQRYVSLVESGRLPPPPG